MLCTRILSPILLVFLMAASAWAQSESPSYQQLKEMSIFLGEWRATTQLPEGIPPSEKLGPLAGRPLNLTQSFRWAPGQSALIAEYRFELKDATPIRAISLIGWDQNHHEIRSHEFTSEKGVWLAVWKQEGDIWVSSFEGTDLDGAKHTGKRTFQFTDADHCLVRDIEQTKEGQPLPDVEYHFVRQKQPSKE